MWPLQASGGDKDKHWAGPCSCLQSLHADPVPAPPRRALTCRGLSEEPPQKRASTSCSGAPGSPRNSVPTCQGGPVWAGRPRQCPPGPAHGDAGRAVGTPARGRGLRRRAGGRGLGARWVPVTEGLRARTTPGQGPGGTAAEAVRCPTPNLERRPVPVTPSLRCLDEVQRATRPRGFFLTGRASGQEGRGHSQATAGRPFRG